MALQVAPIAFMMSGLYTVANVCIGNFGHAAIHAVKGGEEFLVAAVSGRMLKHLEPLVRQVDTNEVLPPTRSLREILADSKSHPVKEAVNRLETALKKEKGNKTLRLFNEDPETFDLAERLTDLRVADRFPASVPKFFAKAAYLFTEHLLFLPSKHIAHAVHELTHSLDRAEIARNLTREDLVQAVAYYDQRMPEMLEMVQPIRIWLESSEASEEMPSEIRQTGAKALFMIGLRHNGARLETVATIFDVEVGGASHWFRLWFLRNLGRFGVRPLAKAAGLYVGHPTTLTGYGNRWLQRAIYHKGLIPSLYS